jgi:hypothetical protein
MARGVDDVDFGVFIGDGGILGQNGDAPFPLDVVGVHNPLGHFLIGPENAALFQQFVHQSGLAVIHMGNDGHIPYIFSFLLHKIPPDAGFAVLFRRLFYL